MATSKRTEVKRALPVSQPENRNFLAANTFGFFVDRAPTVGFFGSVTAIPGMNLGVANQMNYMKNIPRPGEVIEFEDLTLQFYVDEDLQNYLEIQQWMRGLGFPQDIQEIYDWQKEAPYDRIGLNLTGTASLVIYNNQLKPSFTVRFEDVFPYYLGPLEFNSQLTEAENLQCQVSFKYSIYTIEPGGGGCC